MKAKEQTLYCGGCYRAFRGAHANELLRAHVEDDPCEHYVTVAPEQLIAREYQLERLAR